MGLLLVLDLLFFQLVTPLPVLFFWLACRAAYALAALVYPTPRPPSLDTPWDLSVYLHTLAHGVRIIDAEPLPSDEPVRIPRITHFRGAVLANHRSWGDLAFDPMQAHASVVARFAGVAVGGITGFIGWASHRVIVIFRGRTSRQQLQAMCDSHERYLIYPEGTRRANQPNCDEPALPLKAGGLKNVYEAGHAALIVITVNKEGIISEYKGTTSCCGSVTLYRARHEPIFASDHPTFESYLAAIEEAWVDTWRRAYRLRSEATEIDMGDEEEYT